LDWWNGLEGVNKAVWAEVKAEFLKDYEYRIDGESQFRMLTLKQKAGETVVDFFSRVSLAMQDVKKGVPASTDDQVKAGHAQAMLHVLKNLFISGLREDLRKEVLRHTITTLTQAKEQARKAEFLHATGQLENRGISSLAIEEMVCSIEQVVQLDDKELNEDELCDEEIAVINHVRHRRGKKLLRFPRRRIAATGAGTPRGPFNGKCFNCDKVGHLARNCLQPRREQVRSVDEERKETASIGLAPLNW
jgi:hypothetical protein